MSGRLICKKHWAECGLAAALFMGAAPFAFGTALLVDVGHLGGGTSLCNDVSPDDTLVVGQSNDGSHNQAFLWTSSNGMVGLGYLDENYPTSVATAVDADTGGTVHITGSSNIDAAVPNPNTQAFHWLGPRSGIGGSMVPIDYITGGGPPALGHDLRVHAGGVLVVGECKHAGYQRGFNWNSGDNTVSELVGGFTRNTRAYGVGWRPGPPEEQYEIGYADMADVTNMPYRCHLLPQGGFTLGGTETLDHICGRHFWMVAGPDGDVDSTDTCADDRWADSHHAPPPQETGLDPEEIIICSGSDQWLQTLYYHSGCAGMDADNTDDPGRPVGHSDDTSSDSRARGCDLRARFAVGRSSYPGGDPVPPHNYRPYQAFLHDVEVHDGEYDFDGNDHCSGAKFNYGLGFLSAAPPSGQTKSSEALAISSTVNLDSTREGLVIVGYSGYLDLANDNKVRADNKTAAIWFIHDFGTCGLHNIVVDIHNLKEYLESLQAGSTAGWGSLNEATSVSDDGKVVAGWGYHNGQQRGFVAYLDTSVLPTGACCNLSLAPPCTDNMLEVDCRNSGGNWQGSRTTCANRVCCHTPFADQDGDGDVDQMDFAAFQLCFGASPIPDNCKCWDRGGTANLVDTNDFAEFQKCWTGPDVLFDPEHPPTGCTP